VGVDDARQEMVGGLDFGDELDDGDAVAFDLDDGGGVGVEVGGEVLFVGDVDDGFGVEVPDGVGWVEGGVLGVFLRKTNLSRRKFLRPSILTSCICRGLSRVSWLCAFYARFLPSHPHCIIYYVYNSCFTLISLALVPINTRYTPGTIKVVG
jgi:hypothetical protein